MNLEEAIAAGSVDHESGAIRLRGGVIEVLQVTGPDGGEWGPIGVINVGALPREGWLHVWEQDGPFNNVHQLDPEALTYRDHSFTPLGMRVSADYCQAWLRGERRIDIEERYPDLAGSFHDFRTCDELCGEHAAHDDGRENTHKALEP